MARFTRISGRLRRAFLATVAIAALVLPSGVFAATLTSSGTETLTVSNSSSISGVPAALLYGAALGGTVQNPGPFDLTATTNSPTGYSIEFTQTALTAGANTIPAGATGLSVQGTVSGPCPVNLTTWKPAGTGVVATGAAQTVCTSPTAGTSVLHSVLIQLTIPVAAVPGAYSGSFTASIVEN